MLRPSVKYLRVCCVRFIFSLFCVRLHWRPEGRFALATIAFTAALLYVSLQMSYGFSHASIVYNPNRYVLRD